MNKKFIDSLMKMPFDDAVAQIDELAAAFAEVHGERAGLIYRTFLVNRAIRCVQGVM